MIYLSANIDIDLGIQVKDTETPDDLAILTRAEAKSWLDVYSGDTDRDLLIDDLIKGARETLEKRYNMTITSRERQLFYERHSLKVQLKHGPHQSVTTVERLTDSDGTYTTLTAPDDFYETGLDYPILNFIEPGCDLRVTVSSGFSSLPFDIKKAWLMQIKYMFDGDWDVDEQIPPEVVRIMTPYDKSPI